jgi:hypothetical protein
MALRISETIERMVNFLLSRKFSHLVIGSHLTSSISEEIVDPLILALFRMRFFGFSALSKRAM